MLPPDACGLVVLTGASRGLGLAMAHQLLAQRERLLCISRHPNPALDLVAARSGLSCEQWAADLGEAEPVATRLRSWLQQQDSHGITHVTLINNAAVLPDIAPLADSLPLELAQALRVGLEAPMLLCAAFLDATRDWDLPRRVLNISSGLGRRPMASQSAYCAAKAGLDMLTRCLALDEANHTNGARVCALAPGVIDTDMQVQLRSARPQAFPDQQRFAQLQAQGQLISPDAAATRVLAYLARPDFGLEPVADVRG